MPCTRVQFVNAANGAPLAENDVVQIGDLGSSQVGSYVTDADGRVDLALPPGIYMVTARDERLHRVVDDPTRWAKLEWDASGPRTTTLRVPR